MLIATTVASFGYICIFFLMGCYPSVDKELAEGELQSEEVVRAGV